VEAIHPRVEPGLRTGIRRRAADGDVVTPYGLVVSSTVRAAADVAEPQPAAGRHQAAELWRRGLGLGVIAFVTITSFQGRPAPGGRGESLAVAVALVGFSCATAGVIWLARARPATQLTLLLVAVISAATLIGLQPKGPGLLAVFPAVIMAALRLPVRLGAVVAGVALAAVTAAWAARGQVPVVGIVLNDSGVVAFYVVATFARQLRESNERAEVLLAELEQTRAAQAQAAVLAERQRLAREMHDVLAHSLSGLVLNLEGARLLVGQGGAGTMVGDAIERAHRLARTGLEEARRAIGMLRDDALPGPERLAGLAAELESDIGVACTVAVTGTERELGTDGRLTLYRVAQEALTNIRKHARPGRVEVRLAYEPAGTRLTIENVEEAGERMAAGDGSGYGLTGMKERAELLGGTLAAGPTDRGFLVELWVPA
jgi:signal transduction histidine kinase